MPAMVRLLKADEAAGQLGTTREVVYSPRWRSRVGLRAVRIGRSLRFRQDDVLALVQRGTESSPGARAGPAVSGQDPE
jgi:excisionase family DNA binding protein